MSLKGFDGTGILNGPGLPANSLGANGDFYINTTNTTLIGPKSNGVWPGSGVSLIGAAGQNGTNGTNGQNGAAGTNGTNGTNGNTILSGAGNPANTLGADGDFYINISNTTLIGPKTGGVWPGSGVSLIGAAGANGMNGMNGAAGQNGMNGAAGAAGANGNTILSGAGTPANSLGKD